MTRLIFALYAIFAIASTALAQPQESPPLCRLNEAAKTELKTAARGLFSSLIFSETPYHAGDLSFRDAEGKHLTLSAFKGKFLLVNMWAMWCAPCRAEMADLAQLARQSADDNFAVIAINMDKDNVDNARIENFLTEVEATNLALYRDEKMDVFRQVRRSIPARGLPLTLIIDDEGCLVASYAGAAPWGNEDAAYFVNVLQNQKN